MIASKIPITCPYMGRERNENQRDGEGKEGEKADESWWWWFLFCNQELLVKAPTHQLGRCNSQGLGKLDKPAIVCRPHLGQHMSLCVIRTQCMVSWLTLRWLHSGTYQISPTAIDFFTCGSVLKDWSGVCVLIRLVRLWTVFVESPVGTLTQDSSGSDIS